MGLLSIGACFDFSATAIPSRSSVRLSTKWFITLFTTFPHDVWTQIWVDIPAGQRNREVHHPDAVGIVPNQIAIIRPTGVVLAQETEERAEGYRYLGLGLGLGRRTVTRHSRRSAHNV